MQAVETIGVMKKELKKNIDHLEPDEVQKVSIFISKIQAKNLSKSITQEWDERNISREKIQQAVSEYRKSKHK